MRTSQAIAFILFFVSLTAAIILLYLGRDTGTDANDVKTLFGFLALIVAVISGFCLSFSMFMQHRRAIKNKGPFVVVTNLDLGTQAIE
jgi:hypothetical protein